jgi:hypothetical protein
MPSDYRTGLHYGGASFGVLLGTVALEASKEARMNFASPDERA